MKKFESENQLHANNRKIVLIIRKYVLWTMLLLKRQLTKVAVWGLYLGIPILLYGYTHVVHPSGEAVMHVGLYAADEDGIVLQTIQELCNRDGNITFYQAQSEEQLENDVRNRKAASGYVFLPEFTQHMLQQDLRQRIKVYALSTDKLSSVTNELVYTQLFRNYGDLISDDYVVSNEVFSQHNEQARIYIKEAYRQFMQSDTVFHLNIEMIQNDSSEPEEHSEIQVFPIRSILYLLVLFAGLFGGAWWKKEQRAGLFRTMSVVQTRCAVLLYSGVVAGLCAVSALVSLVITETHIRIWEYEVPHMILYLTVVLIFTEISCFIPDEILYITWVLVYLVFCLVVQLILTDTATVLPAAAMMKKFAIPSYFIS